MKRVNNYLVVEDGGERTDELYRALEVIKKQGGELSLNHERRVGRMLSKADYSIERLATYDAFFVDFHLGTEQNFEQPTKVKIPIGEKLEEVTVTTGMGVLLYLTEIFKTDKYIAARDEHAKLLPRERRRPQLYAFVELKAVQSRFYAAAAQSWLGADYFRAITNPTVLASRLMDLERWRSDREATIVKNAVEPFNQLMNCKLEVTRSAWGSIPEAYDWLRFYYQADGALGGREGFKQVVTKELRITPTWTNATVQYADRELNPIQDAIKAFLAAYPQGDTGGWPVGKYSLTWA
jgi:hypothetical protein